MKVENGSDEIITDDKKKPKMKTKTVQNPLEVTSSKKGYSAKELQDAWERENAMVSLWGTGVAIEGNETFLGREQFWELRGGFWRRSV